MKRIIFCIAAFAFALSCGPRSIPAKSKIDEQYSPPHPQLRRQENS